MTITVDHPDIYADSGVWTEAEKSVASAKRKVDGIASSTPTLPGPFSEIQTKYGNACTTAQNYFTGGVGKCAAIGSTLLENSGVHKVNDGNAATGVKSSGGNRGGTDGGNHDGDGDKYKGKLEPHVDQVPPPTTPVPPNDPKDDAIYAKLAQLVNGLLEEDGVRLNAFDTNDPFDQSQETVVAYTDADGKVHVISTNPNQGVHATAMTMSFVDEDGHMHVITSVDGKMVEDTPSADGTAMERRVVAQGTLDQMMAEAKEVSISYTDDKGVEQVISTDKQQGGQMNQVVVAYADENGQQHMVSNEKGIDAPSSAHNPAYGMPSMSQLNVATFEPMTSLTGGKA